MQKAMEIVFTTLLIGTYFGKIATNTKIDAMRIVYNQITMVLYKYCVLRILYN